MLEGIKKRIGTVLLRNKIKKHSKETFSFTQFITNSFDYVIILPLEEPDFTNGFDIVRYLQIHKKNITLVLPDFKRNLISDISKYKTLEYSIIDINNFGLPSKNLENMLSEKKFDVLLDLERSDNIFLIAVSSVIEASFKVGFNKEGVENLYNFQLVNNKINSEISYRNLLNSLKMF